MSDKVGANLRALKRGRVSLQNKEGAVTKGIDGSVIRLTVDLPTSFHRSLKLFAVQEGVSMSDVVRYFVSQLEDDGVRERVTHALRGH